MGLIWLMTHMTRPSLAATTLPTVNSTDPTRPAMGARMSVYSRSRRERARFASLRRMVPSRVLAWE
ncbi:hypothetical protein DSECCO2_588200 [anaerobic digester metagenome]